MHHILTLWSAFIPTVEAPTMTIRHSLIDRLNENKQVAQNRPVAQQNRPKIDLKTFYQ